VTPGAGPQAEADVAFGIDIGGTKVLGVALGPSEGVLVEARVATPGGPVRGDDVGRGVARAVAEVVAQLDAAVAPPAGDAPAPAIGVGVPGMVDRAGRLRFSPNLPQAHGVDWHVLLSEHLPGRRILIENDANLAALAEHRLGAAQGYDHVLTVTLGTGIGGALIVDGRLRVGRHGYAGEIGHLVVDPAGPPCPCGRRGCWERYASGGGLGLLAREAAMAGRLPGVVALAGGDPESVRGEDVTAAAVAGDADAREVMEQLGWWVGFGLANLTCVLDPECIVLGGGLVGAGALWLGAARAAFAELVEGGSAREPVVIVPATFGERAGAVGAAVGARQGGLW
jgi:glucokinase